MSYVIPKPSICDGCLYAYYLTTGSAGFGDLNYMQRYCAIMPKSLHQGGVKDCSRITINWNWTRIDDPNKLMKIALDIR